MKRPEQGGQARISPDDYIEGAPELVLEIVGSSSAHDLHQKKTVYRRNGVREYLVWITGEQRVIPLTLPWGLEGWGDAGRRHTGTLSGPLAATLGAAPPLPA